MLKEGREGGREGRGRDGEREERRRKEWSSLSLTSKHFIVKDPGGQCPQSSAEPSQNPVSLPLLLWCHLKVHIHFIVCICSQRALEALIGITGHRSSVFSFLLLIGTHAGSCPSLSACTGFISFSTHFPCFQAISGP